MSPRLSFLLLVVTLLSLLSVGTYTYAASLNKETEPAARVDEILSIFVSSLYPCCTRR